VRNSSVIGNQLAAWLLCFLRSRQAYKLGLQLSLEIIWLHGCCVFCDEHQHAYVDSSSHWKLTGCMAAVCSAINTNIHIWIKLSMEIIWLHGCCVAATNTNTQVRTSMDIQMQLAARLLWQQRHEISTM